MYHSKIFVPLLCLVLFIAGAASSYAAAVEKESDDSSAASAQPSITARSAVLIDADSGTVLFENNADEETSPGQRHKSHDDAAHHGSRGFRKNLSGR